MAFDGKWEGRWRSSIGWDVGWTHFALATLHTCSLRRALFWHYRPSPPPYPACVALCVSHTFCCAFTYLLPDAGAFTYLPVSAVTLYLYLHILPHCFRAYKQRIAAHTCTTFCPTHISAWIALPSRITLDAYTCNRNCISGIQRQRERAVSRNIRRRYCVVSRSLCLSHCTCAVAWSHSPAPFVPSVKT